MRCQGRERGAREASLAAAAQSASTRRSALRVVRRRAADFVNRASQDCRLGRSTRGVTPSRKAGFHGRVRASTPAPLQNAGITAGRRLLRQTRERNMTWRERATLIPPCRSAAARGCGFRRRGRVSQAEAEVEVAHEGGVAAGEGAGASHRGPAEEELDAVTRRAAFPRVASNVIKIPNPRTLILARRASSSCTAAALYTAAAPWNRKQGPAEPHPPRSLVQALGGTCSACSSAQETRALSEKPGFAAKASTSQRSSSRCPRLSRLWLRNHHGRG